MIINKYKLIKKVYTREKLPIIARKLLSYYENRFFILKLQAQALCKYYAYE